MARDNDLWDKISIPAMSVVVCLGVSRLNDAEVTRVIVRQLLELPGNEPFSDLLRDVRAQSVRTVNPREFRGFSKADSMLVAKAMECGGTVVTLETSEPRRQNRVKTPDACRAHGVTYMTPYELLRHKGVRLIK